MSTSAEPTTLKAYQQQLALQSKLSPQSAQTHMQELLACVQKALTGLEQGHTVSAQQYLDQSLTSLLLAYHYMNMDVERVLGREQHRLFSAERTAGRDRIILVFSDHAELRVDGELRGTIPLYSPEDYQEVCQMAAMFQCRLEHAEHVQLNVFNLLKAGSQGAR